LLKHKKLEKDDLLLLIETQFVVTGKFRNYGLLGHSEGPNCIIITPKS